MNAIDGALSAPCIELLEQAGIDPARADPGDVQLAMSAVAQGVEIFARSKRYLSHIEVFGDFRTALVAAGVV